MVITARPLWMSWSHDFPQAGFEAQVDRAGLWFLWQEAYCVLSHHGSKLPFPGSPCHTLSLCQILPGPGVVVGSVEMDRSGAFSLKCCSCETQHSRGQGAREALGYFLLSAGTCIAAVLRQISCGGFSALLLPHATDLNLEFGVVRAVVVSLWGGYKMVFLSLSLGISVAVYLPSLSFALCNLLLRCQWLFFQG